MAAFSRSYVTQKLRTLSLCSYSRMSVIRFYQKRFLNEAVVIPPPKYGRNAKGYIDQPEPQSLPEGMDLDPEVNELCELDPLRYPKRHPGLIGSKKAPFLPDRLVQNARHILQEKELICNSNFATEVRHLYEVYLRRQPPIDNADKEEQRQMIAKQLLIEEFKDKEITFDDLSQEQQQKLRQRVTDVAKKIYNKTVHNWKKLVYGEKMAYVYMAARLIPNYSVLQHIFKELYILDPAFEPSAILNVGSGAGSVIWAADYTWADWVNEYYNVDVSKNMNDLARLLLAKDTSNPDDMIINGVFFRQFMPSPRHVENRFPLVVSAYLLMDLPSRKARIDLIFSMWELTQDYLILVEHGTSAGYRLIQEARQVVLQMQNEDPAFEGHVVAPCTHDYLCAKLQFKNSPCTFSLKYRQLNLGVEYGQGDTIMSERFSYVVLKKGPRSSDGKYPRITHVQHKAKCSHCHVCCPDGSLRHYVFSKTKPSRNLYRCVSKTQPGDLLPVLWPQPKPGDTTLADTEQSHVGETIQNDTAMGDSEMINTEATESGSGEVIHADTVQSHVGETIQKDTAMGDSEIINAEATESSSGEVIHADSVQSHEGETIQTDPSLSNQGEKS